MAGESVPALKFIPPTFMQCVDAVLEQDEMIFHFNRLSGCNFGRSLKRTRFEVAIDEATGYPGEDPEDVRKFLDFVRDCVWLPLLAQAVEP